MFTDISLFRLQVLVKVVEAGGFKPAAERLKVSQPAVSNHLKALENELGIVLLERGRKPKLTYAGRLVYQFAHNTLQQAQEIERLTTELRQAEVGQVAIGASLSLGKHVLPGMLCKFARLNSGIHLRLSTGITAKICDQVLTREVDLGLIMDPGHHFPALALEPWRPEELVVVAYLEHPLARQTLVPPVELANYGFVTPHRQSNNFQLVQNALSNHGIVLKHSLLELDDPDCIKKAVLEGVGLAALLRCCVHEELYTGKLVQVRLNTSPIIVPTCLVYRQDKLWSPSLQKFTSFLRKNM